MAEDSSRNRLQRTRDWIARRYSSLTPGSAKASLDSKGSYSSTGITFKVASHGSESVTYQGLQNPTPQAVLDQFRGGPYKEIYQSSLKPTGEFLPDRSGFVSNIVLAYSKHHNLILRPDDIWVAILSQFNLYVNANAEDLRSSFVAHKGKKNLHIITDGTIYTIDYGAMAKQFGHLLKVNIVDPSLRDWIIPRFTTTTYNDKVVCSIMMMATLKAYFTYSIGIDCGIPSITLLGTKGDYEAILQRLDRFEEFGVEPAAFAVLLRPILAQFIAAFDAVANGEAPDTDFWQKICHYSAGGSKSPSISGWLTAFCVWNKDGKWQGTQLDELVVPQASSGGQGASRGRLEYEGLRYPAIEIQDIPVGYAEVDVDVMLSERTYRCMMAAGHVGAVISSKENARDTLQPASEWFMFEKSYGGGDPPPSKVDQL